MCWVQLLTSTTQFLRVIIPETLSHDSEKTSRASLSSRDFFRGGQNLLFCYCFRTKFQGGEKVFRGGAKCLSGRCGRKPGAGIFARLLRYFRWSHKNLTINTIDDYAKDGDLNFMQF